MSGDVLGKPRSAPPRPSKGMGARVRKPPAPRPERRESTVLPGESRLGPIRELASASLLYLAATVVLSYPLALHPASLSRLDNGDARLNAWAISWVAHQVIQDPMRLFEANTFHPLPHSLAFSEHLAVLGVLSIPLLRITDDLVLTQNLLLLFSMFASALGMYALARTLTGNDLASLLAGLFFSFGGFRFNRLPHIQMQLYAFLPLFLAAFHLYLRDRKRIYLISALSFFVLQTLSGTYLGAMAAVALASLLATLVPFAGLSRRELGEMAIGLVLVVLVLAPFTAPYLWVNRELGVEWDLEGITSLSATPSSYLASSSRLYGNLSRELFRENPPTDFLFPGLTLLVLAPVGAFLLARDRGKRRILLCYSALLALGLLISLGPHTALYSFLFEHVIFFRGLRALTRFGLLPLTALSVLAAVALAWLLGEGHGLSRRKLAAAAIGLFFIGESTGLPYELSRFRDEPPEVYRWLSTTKPGPFVELPFKVIDTQYMFWARHHGFRPTLNGDSGFIPQAHQWMRSAFLRFPSPDSIELLRRLGVRYVVLHLGAFREQSLLRVLSGMSRHSSELAPVRDFGRDVVFEVMPVTEAAAPDPSKHLAPLSVESSRPDLFDGDVERPVRIAAENAVEIRMRPGAELRSLAIHYGRTPRVPVERVEVLAEIEGVPSVLWVSDPEWPALTELVEGLLRTPLDGTQTLRIEPRTPFPEGPLMLRLYGYDGEPAELTEIEVLGAASIPES